MFKKPFDIKYLIIKYLLIKYLHILYQHLNDLFGEILFFLITVKLSKKIVVLIHFLVAHIARAQAFAAAFKSNASNFHIIIIRSIGILTKPYFAFV